MNIRKTQVIWLFYRKLIVPAVVTTILISLFSIPVNGSYSNTATAVGYIFATFFFQYFIYEVKNPNEYYFYYNLGFTKLSLWSYNLIIGLILFIIILLI